MFKYLDGNTTGSNSVTTKALVLIMGFSPTSQLFQIKQSACFLKGDSLMHSYSHVLSLPGVATELLKLCPPSLGASGHILT